jgi:hypothetical protein
MTCWSHDHLPAVAVCRGCGKALCRSCAQEQGGLIGCSDGCLQRANEVQKTAELTLLKQAAGIQATFKLLFIAGGMMLLFAIIHAARAGAAWMAGRAWVIERDISLAVILGGFAAAFAVGGIIYRRTLRGIETPRPR